MSKEQNTPEEIKTKKHIPDEFKGGRLLNAIIENDKISGIGKSVLLDITRFCNLGENATFREWIYRSKENLVRCTGFNEKAINKHIKILINDGYLLEREHKKKDGRNGPKEFCLTSKIFDDYLYLINRGGDNCQGLTNRGGDNCQGLGGDNCQGLGGDNCHPNHNELQHNEKEHNEKKVKKEISTNLESGVNPRTPVLSKRKIYLLGRQVIGNEDGKKYLSREEKDYIVDALIEEFNETTVFNVLSNIRSEHKIIVGNISNIRTAINYFNKTAQLI